MNFTKKLDRAVQWAGEKMGGEAKTAMSDDFKMLETEMNLRYDGMDRLQKSMTAYVKWVGRRGETFDDKEKGLPISYLGRTMTNHGEDFEHNSEFGNCLTSLGRANERLASAQERYVADATATWLESLERSLAMMKEYQAARKKLENRRLAYDASIGRMQKAKRDDFRVEEELRTNRAKYEESSEDVMRRMQDIKDAEVDSIRDLTGFLDCELDYHERCVEELRRVKRSWPGTATAAAAANGSLPSNFGGRSRSNTARSYNNERNPPYGSRAGAGAAGDSSYMDEEPEPLPVRMPNRANTNTLRSANDSPPQKPARPAVARANSFQPGSNGPAAANGPPTTFSTYNNNLMSATASPAAITSLRTGLRPVGRIQTTNGHPSNGNVFADDNDDTSVGSGSGSGSPEWGERSASPATSFGSLSRSTSNVAMSSGGAVRKAPPPPPPNRNKKPPPPVPAPRRETNY
ncbi:bar domain containing protein [Sporothrix schenckii 1099-18]|uniref:BAR domain-containing protein n=2 Tax=Sporothrix schenckii TaxID=29908 RepID=U7Q260_SPOS1|nr:bar domain containing protein [Sporothrix schenckii 1099-18]ERT01095.1 hypothetical protein HMPREF1624_02334 [Sporothrix schenckii ATCC 58251]KJR88227.1 bar domain containing protein [Sporothrix schenckii 1099-18]